MSTHLYRYGLWRENTRGENSQPHGNRRRGTRGGAFAATGTRWASAVTFFRRGAGSVSSSAACRGTSTSATLRSPSWQTRKCTLTRYPTRLTLRRHLRRHLHKGGGSKVTSTCPLNTCDVFAKNENCKIRPYSVFEEFTARAKPLVGVLGRQGGETACNCVFRTAELVWFPGGAGGTTWSVSEPP